MRVWHFTEGTHKPTDQWARLGKPEWPDMVCVVLSEGRALELVARLANALRARDDEDEPIDIVLTGQLREDTDA